MEVFLWAIGNQPVAVWVLIGYLTHFGVMVAD